MATFSHLRKLQELEALTACANQDVEDDTGDVVHVGKYLKVPRRKQPHDDLLEVMISSEFKEAFGFTKENFK